MKDKTMLKIALATTIIGLASLAALAEFIEIGIYTISEAKNAKSDVKVSGVADSVKAGKEIVRFKLTDEYDEIDVVLFDEFDMQNGDYVEVEGRVGEYQGKKQIVARRIILAQP